MQGELQITAKGVTLSEGEASAIRQASRHLETFWDRLTSCRVVVEMPRRRGHSGRLYNIRIEVGVPGQTLLIRQQPREDLLTAIQVAFKAAERRVQDAVRRTRGDVKLGRAAPKGVVTRLLPWEGYGFITDAAGREIYFSRQSVLGAGFDRLEEGMDVRFTEEPGEKGPQASSVMRARRRGAAKPPA
jgi:cold shock CspA family protein/ribosome-associated translation inhibitor RaiA